jgi:hypothetical protein
MGSMGKALCNCVVQYHVIPNFNCAKNLLKYISISLLYVVSVEEHNNESSGPKSAVLLRAVVQ